MTKRQALVIGINEYLFDPEERKLTAAEDAEKIAQLLETFGGFEVHRLPCKEGVREVNSEKNLNLKELEDAITQLFLPKSGIIPETALLFFAGHGWRSEKNGQPEGFLVTSDALFDHDSEDGLFSLKRLHQILKDSPVRQQIVWLDCCHSGELFNLIEQNLAEFEQQRDFDRCFIAACREFQVAYGGVLTPALLQALDPTNKDDGRVTNYTLKPRLEAIPNNASQHFVVSNIGSQIILTYKGGVRGKICPYKGLEYFDFNPIKHQEAQDHKYFYGRTELTEQLLKKVRSSNFLGVIGQSGSGKSSVVRAGLLYQLYLGKNIPGSDRWTIYQPFTPGINPIKSLEQVVGKLTEPDDLVHFIERLPKRVVLVIDQFEEIFTQCRDEQERQKFFSYLMGAVERLGNKLCLVLVMRDDFQHKCSEQDYAGLANKIDNNLVRVQRMNRQDLQDVILKPAELVELEIDSDLVQKMISDVSDSPGDLALLQYTLTQLWDNSSFNLLTISDYTSLGGVQKALENHADTVYQSLLSEEQKADGLKESEEQRAARRIFLELSRLSEDENTPNTRQQVWLKDLVNSQQSEELVNKVVQCLADAKLVVTSEQQLDRKRVAVVNIVHETLIRNWGLLDGWLKDNRKALIIKQPIEDAAKEWRDKGKQRESAYLLQGTKLAAAEDYIKRYSDLVSLSGSTQEFVQKSIQNRKRNRRNLAVTISAVFVVFSGLAGLVSIERENAQINTLSESSKASFASDKQIEALTASITAGKRLKEPLGAIGAKADTRMKVVTALQQAVYRVTGGKDSTNFVEQNRLNGNFKSVDISPDGQMIVSADSDTIKLWSYDSKLLKTIQGKQGRINSAKFSPKNSIIASAGNDGTIKLWNLDGSLRKTIQHGEAVKDISLSPDGKTIVSVVFGDSLMKIWSIDGTLLKTIKADSSRFDKVRFSPDSQTIASIGTSGIELWSRNGTLLKTLKLKQGAVMNLSFSPDGKTIATATGSDFYGTPGDINLWNREGKLLKTFQGHNNIIFGLSFSPDSKTIASASADNTIKLWKLDGTLLQTLTGHNNQVNSVSFSPNGKMLASLSNDGTVRFWNRNSTSLKILQGGSWVTSISFSPDGQMIVSSSLTNIQLWNRDGKLLKTFQGDRMSVINLSFSPDSQIIGSVGNGTVKLWNRDGNLFRTITGVNLNFSPDNQTIASVDSDGIVKLWNRNGNLLKTLQLDSKDVRFSPDNQLIASLGRDGTVKLWNRDGTQSQILGSYGRSNIGNNIEFKDMSFSPNGQTIAIAGEDGTAKLWDLNGKLITILKGHTTYITSISFSPDGETIATGSSDRTIKLWSRNGTLLQTFQHKAMVFDVSFSPDGKILASGSSDGQGDPAADKDRYNTMILWNLDIDDLIMRGCSQVRGYLNNPNTNLSDQERQICDSIKSPPA